GFIVRDPSGAAIRVVGSALDATESRTAMKKIKDQNKILRDIAWEQSHLVRAPLARLKGLLDMLESGDTSILSADEIIQLMSVSYEELDSIVRSIVHKSAQIDPPPLKDEGTGRKF